VELPAQVVNVSLAQGGVGDNIARIPALRYAIRNFRHALFYIYAPEGFISFLQAILKSELGDDEAAMYQVLPLDLWDRRLRGMEVDFKPIQISSLSMGLVENGFLHLCNRLPASPGEAEYPVFTPSPRDVLNTDPILKARAAYVVVTTGFTSPVREWPVAEINDFILRTKKEGLNVVLLGSSKINVSENFQVEVKFNERIRSDLCEDLRDQTTIKEACEILGNAVCVVGVDNGLLHLASCTSVPVIWGFTSVDPKHRIPVRNGKPGFNAYTVQPSATLDCRACQSRYHFFEHDFRQCLALRLKGSTGISNEMLASDPSGRRSEEKSIECLKDMKGEKFFHVLKTRILNKLNVKR
jgi:hypothetical protein